MTNQTGRMSRGGLDLAWCCDVCGRDRAHGNHNRCSRIRQDRYRAMRKTETVQQGGNQNA